METAEITRPDRSFIEASTFSDLSDLTEHERVITGFALASKPEPEVRVIRLIARDKVVMFNYLDDGEPKPAWFFQVLQGFANLVTLPDNWDGEGARRIHSATLNRGLAAVERLLPRSGTAPSVVPISDGGYQIEWHRNGQDLEIEFNPTGAIEFYYYNEQTSEESEGPVGPNFVLVKDYLQRIW